MSEYKNDFPIFKNRDICYLDSAATSQKPKEIIEKNSEYYENNNGNPGRGSHELSIINSSLVESIREKVAKFVGVSDKNNIVFTKNTTESINLIVFGYAMNNLKKDDEVIIAISNHHANIVPWQVLANKKNINLRYIYLDKDGEIDLNTLEYMINEKTKIISISSVVNSTGIIQNFKKVIDIARKYNAKVILDCAQSIIHFKHEFEKWDVDFAAFSGHKMFANQGIGILYGKKELLNITEPLIYGGDMVEHVDERKYYLKDIPTRFEGGTLNVEGIVSLKNAIDYINKVGYEYIEKHENRLKTYAMFSLLNLGFVDIYYSEGERVGIIPFNVKGVHPHDVSFILDNMKIAIRSGAHCSAPLMEYLNIKSCCRVSFGIYNTEEDVDKLIEGLIEVKKYFKD